MSDQGNRYPQYPQPGQAPVHAPQQGGVPQQPQPMAPQAYPQTPQAPVQVPQQQQQPMPPQAYQQPQQGHPTNYQPPSTTPGFDQIDPGVRAALEQELQNKGDDQQSGQRKARYFKPKKPQSRGESAVCVIRILPGWQGIQSPYWYKQSTHFCLMRLDDGKVVRVPRACPQFPRVGHEPSACPICERRELALAEGDSPTAKELAPRSRFMLNVLDLEDLDSHYVEFNGQTTARSKVWGVGQKQFYKLGKIIGMRGPIYDLNAGHNIHIHTTKTGPEVKNIEYELIDDGSKTAVPPGFENIEIVPLDQLEIISDYDTLLRELADLYPTKAAQRPQVKGYVQAPQQAQQYAQQPQQYTAPQPMVQQPIAPQAPQPIAPQAPQPIAPQPMVQQPMVQQPIAPQPIAPQPMVQQPIAPQVPQPIAPQPSIPVGHQPAERVPGEDDVPF